MQHWLVDTLACLAALAFAQYILTILIRDYILCKTPQNLQTKYHAKWALVTGASSGIGKAITQRLAAQGINVVLVALEDQLLGETLKELKDTFPEREFVSCGVDLSGGDYLEKIKEVTKDMSINLVFNNAGYIKLGHFADMPLDAQLRNLECNATSAVKITHLFLNRMIDARSKGFISFTSSSASFFPNPISAMYGSSKAFLTEFATSVAAEVKDLGIDVLVVHPSPIASRFYIGSENVSAVKFFQNTAKGPEVIADAILAGAGKLTVWDEGYFSILVKLLLKVLDWNIFAEIMTYTARLNVDHLKLRKHRSN